jgi:hypothetical protein
LGVDRNDAVLYKNGLSGTWQAVVVEGGLVDIAVSGDGNDDVWGVNSIGQVLYRSICVGKFIATLVLEQHSFLNGSLINLPFCWYPFTAIRPLCFDTTSELKQAVADYLGVDETVKAAAKVWGSDGHVVCFLCPRLQLSIWVETRRRRRR